MTLTVPADLAELLEAAARARRTTPERFAEFALRHATHMALEPRPPAPPPPAPGESLLDEFREALGMPSGSVPVRPVPTDSAARP